MNYDDAIATARAFPRALIFPVHHQGWEHFTETLDDLAAAFARAGLSDCGRSKICEEIGDLAH